MKKRYYSKGYSEWKPTKRADDFGSAWPFFALIGGVAALVGLLIWIIEILK